MSLSYNLTPHAFVIIHDLNPHSDVCARAQKYVGQVHHLPASVELGHLHTVETVDGYRFTARAKSTQAWLGDRYGDGPCEVVDYDVEETVGFSLEGATWIRYSGPTVVWLDDDEQSRAEVTRSLPVAILY